MDSVFLLDTMLFRGMSAGELTDCLFSLSAKEMLYDKDALILPAGDRTERMGVVLEGSVTIESNDLWGNRTILSHAGKGQFFAETYALLPEEVMPVDVRANEACRILFLRIGGQQRLLGMTSPWKNKFVGNLLTVSAHKNLSLSGRSFHTAPKSARGRILAYLGTVSLQKQSREFDIPFDRQQLADYLNLERTNMSKELTKMKKDGLLLCRKNHFKLLGCI